MGRYLEDKPTTTTTTSELFQQAERRAFADVGQALGKMVFCSLPDLEQAAFSYCVQSFTASGVGIREEWARRKASTWAAWWFRKHRDTRSPRPHSKYSVDQAKRGRDVAAIRKRTRNDWEALRVQLARQGSTVAEVAGDLGCSARFVYKLSKRKFSPLLVAVLLAALGVNVPKGSVGFQAQNSGIDQKETLRPFTIDEGAGPITAVTGGPGQKLGAETASTDVEGDELETIRAVIEATKAHLAGAGVCL